MDDHVEDDQIEVTVEAKLNCPRDLIVEVLKKQIKAQLLQLNNVDEVIELNVFTV